MKMLWQSAKILLTFADMTNIIKLVSSSKWRLRGEIMRIKLINFRKTKKLTQAQAAKFIGISRQHYARIESGERTPSLAKSIEIKKFFDYFSDDIFDNTLGH